jgi:hypothetical protein
MIGMLIENGNLFNPRVWWEALRFTFGPCGAYLIAPSFFSYFKIGFHPSHVKIDAATKPHIHEYKINEQLERYFPKVDERWGKI